MKTTRLHHSHLLFRIAGSLGLLPFLAPAALPAAGNKTAMLLMVKVLAVSVLLCLLAGCKIELYSQMEEQQGNEMLALLLENGISSEKSLGKGNLVSLYVDEKKISAAIAILRRNGFPKDNFSTIKDMFGSDKLIYTPFEDQARYNYGLSQEIAETLSQVDGVIAVRVHLVMPEERRGGQPADPASASVFIKHNPAFDFNDHIPEIKSIVANGIVGMSYGSVTVALFPAQKEGIVSNTQHRPGHLEEVLSLKLAKESVPRFYLVVGSLLALIFLSLMVNIYLLFSRSS